MCEAPSRNTTPVGTQRATKLLNASSFTPTHFTSTHEAASQSFPCECTLPHSAVQRYPRNSSSEQETGSSYLSSSAGHYSPTTVAPSSNASHVERSSARTVFTISWLGPYDSRIPPVNASDGAVRSEFDRAAP